jgi:hypothetical protein
VKNAYRCGGGIANDHGERKYLCLHKKPPARDFSQPAAKVPCRQLMICAKLVALGDSFKPNEFSKCHETNEQKEAR